MLNEDTQREIAEFVGRVDPKTLKNIMTKQDHLKTLPEVSEKLEEDEKINQK